MKLAIGRSGSQSDVGIPNQNSLPRKLYRAITELEPEQNVLSNKAKGRKPHGPEVTDPDIRSGLSIWDTMGHP